jgi:long-chain acyl-CoA synthetase
MGLQDFTFYDLIKRNAVIYKDKIAWFEAEDNRTFTFLQYQEMVDRLASGIRLSGLKKGDRIGVVGKNSVEYFLLFGAAAALGAIIVPINWRLSADEMEFNLYDAGPSLLFADQEYQHIIKGLMKRLSSVQKFFNLKGDEGSFSSYRSLMDCNDYINPEDLSADDSFIIIHTAAITGRPRGALLSHGNVTCANMQFIYLFGFTKDDVYLNAVPLFHVGGLFFAFMSFHIGAINVCMSVFEAAKALDLIHDKNISLMLVFSPMLATLLKEQEQRGVDIRSLKSMAGIESSEAIQKYQELTGGTFYSMYGQTETSCVTTFSPHKERPGSAGRPIPLARVQLVDPYDRLVPEGKKGEITVKGPMVFKEYWNLPYETAYTFRDGWHHTGDLGRFDEMGFLWYEGRCPEKELIKPGGENVYPGEVEKVILTHSAVDKVVVFGVPDPKWKEGIKAVCQLKEGMELDPETLIEFVGERIARFKKPQYVEFVKNIPLNEDHSPDRVKVKKIYGGSQG